MTTRTNKELTDDEMRLVTDAISAKGEVIGLMQLWEIILGYPLCESEDQINPSEFAIPNVQWMLVAQAMIEAADDNALPQARGFPAFVMVNQGPSSYAEDEDESEDT